jgi:hypothetical protein
VTRSHDPADPSDPRDPGETAAPLTADEEREVAALLADAVGRGPVPTPPDVAARLDDVLAGLVAERTAAAAHPEPATVEPSGATVVALDSRRRRWPRVLLAAAAVVGGGYGVSNLVGDGSITADSSSAGSADSGGDSADDSAGGGNGSGPDVELLQDGRDEASPMSVAPPVRPEHLDGDVRRVVRRFGDRPAVGSGSTGGGTGEAPDCPVPRLRDTQQLYVVQFRGAPAGLVRGPRHAGQVDVTIYSCRTGGVQLSRSVTAP